MANRGTRTKSPVLTPSRKGAARELQLGRAFNSHQQLHAHIKKSLPAWARQNFTDPKRP